MNTTQAIPFPDKKYDIIYADPAWKYPTPEANLGRKTPTNTPLTLAYPSLSIEELCGLPVADIANDNSLLFIWIISIYMQKSFEVIESWGFKYVTIAFAWDKQLPVIGHYTHSQVELCLIAKRGCKPKPHVSRNEMQFVSAKKGAHSVKPVVVKRRIERMFPEASKIELFARPLPLFKQLSDGWDYWGNEV